ncbi:hypothetical protein AYO21_07079 [Fonsecaea monophora]|uniref:Major facilitator superfamily (MFS) profile domain-containing protein n=1 Tax=Fonsecaea monophora TaxID=254056 RepID=A0A177F4J7_9EURO|nr:hypothetical protein AYO21_07079 [Fonsecaea monophora]KAH0841486.1 trichothecene efflux pump [Fonsecaea pedrosoi]OAG38726.1 hypothetical protein AYO21_07079 [Fonsecaea monophora]
MSPDHEKHQGVTAANTALEHHHPTLFGDDEIQMHEHEVTRLDQVVTRVPMRTWLAVVSMGWLYIVSLATFLCLVPVITIINEDVGPSPEYSWMANAWTVAAGTGIILTGALSDLVGRRWFIIGCGIAAIIGCILGITAQDMTAAIVAFIFQGLNQAGCLTTFACIAELVPTRTRGIVIGIISLGSAGFVMCGSLIGHAVSFNTGPKWRTIFWMSLACNIVGTVAVAVTYFPAPALARPAGSRREILKSFDYIGILGIMIGPTLFLMGICWVPEYGATSGRFLGPFITGCIVIILLGVYEAKWARNPLLHPYLFRRIRTFTLILICAGVGGMLFYSLQVFWPTYLTLIFEGNSWSKVGIDGFTFGIGTNLGGSGAAILLPFLGPKIGTRNILSFGVLLQVLFIPMMCLVDETRKSMALAFSFMAGIGIGIIELLTILLVQLATPDEWIGFATGALGLVRSMGGSAGSAIYLTIFQDRSAALVPEYVSAAAIEAGLPEDSLPELLGVLTGVVTDVPLTSIPGVTSTILESSALALKKAYLASFRYVWLTSIPFGVIAFFCAVATKDLSHHLTKKVAQHMTYDEKPKAGGEATATHAEDIKAAEGDL